MREPLLQSYHKLQLINLPKKALMLTNYLSSQ